MPVIIKGKTLLYQPSIDVLAVAPPGGTAGQVLAKIDGDDYNYEWVDLPEEPKVYIALLTQTGTNAPVATILENTLGGGHVWSYESSGGYYLTLSNAFTANKTNVEAPKLIWKDTVLINDDVYYKITKVSTSVISIDTYFGGGNTNDLLNKDFIEIRVYP